MNNSSTGIYRINEDRKANNLDRDISIADANRRADNPNTSTSKVDKKLDNQGTSIGTTNAERRINNPGKGMNIVNADKRAKNLSTSTNAVDKSIDNSNIGIANTNVGRKADGQAAISNKAFASLFFLCKAVFILISFFELETIFSSLFIFLLSPLTSVK